MFQRNVGSLSDRVKEEIIRIITTEDFSDNKLPSESKLAARLGVSVAVVREALLLLREDGVITKKHGVGNFFHLSALDSGVRIDQYPGFRDLLHNLGYEVTESIEEMEVIEPDERIRGLLNLKQGDEVVHYLRIIKADGNAAIVCDNYLPLRLFPERPTKKSLKTNALFDIFRIIFKKELAYGQMQFYPYNAEEEDEKRMGIPTGKAMIIMEEEYYSLEDIPLGFSRNKLNGNYITVNMLSR